MATLAATHPTLVDVANRLDPNGSIAKIAEILTQYNEVLDDIAWIEGNLPTGHKTTVRSSIPAGTWRLLNQGITPVKSQANQIIETCGMLENYSEVDKALAQLNGNSAEWRLSEDKAVIEGMAQSLSTALVYGDTSVDPEKFIGLTPRYYATSGATTSDNVISAGGAGSDNTSIWLVGWSEQTVHGIFPKGSKAGLQMTDLGEQTLYDANLGRYQGYRTHYKWDCGLAVRDWRYVVRIANVDISALETAGDASDSSANLLKYMSMALDKFPPTGMTRPVFYMNNRVRAMLRVKLVNKSNTWISLEDWQSPVAGLKRPTLQFMGTPCRRVDSILNTEAVVS